MKALHILLRTLMLLTVFTAAGQKTKVACIGNSITYGYLLPERQTNAYPFQLQRLLGDEYEVGNFGHTGATLLRNGYNPYFKRDEFHRALEFKPDIAIIHLGVNDTDPRCWPNYGDEFATDYLALIDSLRDVNPQVRIILAELTPLRADHPRFSTGTRDWRLKIQQAIRDVAKTAHVELIDFNEPLRDRQHLIFDAIHPDVEGAGILAETVRGAITGNYGGLQLPEIYQSGMVLQRNRPLTFRGHADAGSNITLTLDGRNYHAETDNRGRWEITTAPIVAGPSYSLTVTDATDTIRLTDILAGEVWLASGQSNMEFPLASSVGGREAAASAADSMLRVFNMVPIASNNDGLWPDSVIFRMNRLEHYRPTRWQTLTPEDAGSFSAVAYYFARQLRDSLQVPVGIISNAIGGSPAEAWIDINTLETEMPGILVNPGKNDYLQKWVQQRMSENLGDKTGACHPFKPAYLFATGIRPLASFPLAGVIWYQGESNAHNIELHEKLFPMLVDSWRREFNNRDLPFFYVQLSGIARPSWPEFRNSQRLMSEKIHGVGMAVSHDFGDSLDVHPRNKRPIGDRLARLALHRTYGQGHVADSGPTLSEAKTVGTEIILTFNNAYGLTTSDGLEPKTFEIAEIDGLYFPAKATISGNQIKLSNMDVKNPRFVRYAWQPFTRANIVNADSLPASTFKAEVDNAADFEIEPGYEQGVSAAFSGMLNGELIVAGGCNFPDDPMGPASSKRFYRGIYTADPSSMQWRRIGSMPQPVAYGASASTGKGLVFIGGTTDSEGLRSVYLLNANGLTELDPLPARIDNACAAAIGNRVYVCGGNLNGEPSRDLLFLDLDKAGAKWSRGRSMPGNPRVQPVMAATNGLLYLWGGFAGKHNGKKATIDLDGLCYDPATNKWRKLPAPENADGEAVFLGGGTATTLSNGLIAATGGVNKDIFLEAIQNQAPDYLQHPIPWYRFNQKVLIFDPNSEQWSIAESTPDTARAGASAIAGPNADLYIFGGELKPRIRTSETLHLLCE